MTPTQRLRAAAQLARETAEAATLPPIAADIVIWPPPVALAVAAWLEGCAADLDALMQYTPPDEALAAADALLQTQPVKP